MTRKTNNNTNKATSDNGTQHRPNQNVKDIIITQWNLHKNLSPFWLWVMGSMTLDFESKYYFILNWKLFQHILNPLTTGWYYHSDSNDQARFVCQANQATAYGRQCLGAANITK